MSMSFTLATLKTAIESHVEDTGTDFTGSENTLIQKAEEQVLRDLNLEIFKTTAALTIAQSSRLVSKPTGYIYADSLYYTLSGAVTFLLEKTYEYCVDYAPNTATETAPKFYAELNETQFYVAGTPNAAVAAVGGTCRYTKKPTSLVTNITGTWLSQNVGDLLLQASLVAADEYALVTGPEGKDERLAEYGRRLAAARFQLRHLISREFAPIAAQPTAKEER